MSQSFRSWRGLSVPAVLLLSSACVDLDVTNPNNPDVARALATPADVARVAESSINSWYLGTTHYEPTMALQVTADAATANFGNFGMRFNNLEPRIAYNNNSANSDELVSRRPWNNSYAALGAANDALRAIDIAGIVVPGADNTEKARAAALFAQAASLQNLSMLWDQAFVVTEDTDLLSPPQLQPYTEVRVVAMEKWDELIALTAGKSWVLNDGVLPIGVPTSGVMLNRIANTMAARTLVYNARTGAENTATNWARVLTYANKGITGTGLTDMNFDVVYDDNNWFDFVKLYGNLHSWTRVDQRLANRMSPNIPVKFAGIPAQPVAQPIDNRMGVANLPCGGNPESCLVGITKDYVDLRTTIGDPARGIYMQSTIYHRRYRDKSFAVPGPSRLGPVPFVLAAENDLIIAEALARTGGDLSRAAALVNKTRVTRGGLAPVASTAAAILAAVDYERDVELLNTNGWVPFMDGRRLGRLQPRQWLHLPVPAVELEVLGLPVYTFGGDAPDK